MTFVGEAVAVWTDTAGVPSRLVWNGRRYRVTDTPTQGEIDWEALTHPPSKAPAWRFQGNTDDGDVLMFDVQYDAVRAEWCLLRTYT